MVISFGLKKISLARGQRRFFSPEWESDTKYRSLTASTRGPAGPRPVPAHRDSSPRARVLE